MGNPLFGGPAGQIMQIVNAYQQLKQNPAQIGQFLYEHNKINQSQLNDINQFGGNTGQIGNYLMNQNVMSSDTANQLYQSVPQIQQALHK